MPKLPVVYVCEGADCQVDGRDELVEALANRARIRDVGCQKICEGPVCGVEVGGHLSWFSRVDTEKARDGVVALVGGGPLARALEKRLCPKRAGRLRR